MNDTIAIITLAIVCIGQGIERYYYGKDMTKKLQDCIKAVMSRNIGEYLTATKAPEKQDEPPLESDEVELSDADDKLFAKHINGL